LSYLEGVSKVIANTESADIGLLVNNAGIFEPGEFACRDMESFERLIQLNCVTPTLLTRLFLDRFKNRARSGVIFNCSTAAFQPLPILADYAASKAYLLSLGESIAIELESRSCDVCVLCPGLIKTDSVMNSDKIDMTRAPLGWHSAETAVQKSLHHLGTKHLVITGSLRSKLVLNMHKYLPRRLMLTSTFRILKKALRNQSKH
jgi:short-subunit dehydrogenase